MEPSELDLLRGATILDAEYKYGALRLRLDKTPNIVAISAADDGVKLTDEDAIRWDAASEG